MNEKCQWNLLSPLSEECTKPAAWHVETIRGQNINLCDRHGRKHRREHNFKSFESIEFRRKNK